MINLQWIIIPMILFLLLRNSKKEHFNTATYLNLYKNNYPYSRSFDYPSPHERNYYTLYPSLYPYLYSKDRPYSRPYTYPKSHTKGYSYPRYYNKPYVYPDYNLKSYTDVDDRNWIPVKSKCSCKKTY